MGSFFFLANRSSLGSTGRVNLCNACNVGLFSLLEKNTHGTQLPYSKINKFIFRHYPFSALKRLGC